MNVTASKPAACRGKRESRPPGTSEARRKPSSTSRAASGSHQPVSQNGQGQIETGLQLLVLPLTCPTR